MKDLHNLRLLIELRDKYRNGWTPIYSQLGFAIKLSKSGKYKTYLSTKYEFLSFQSKEVAERFLTENEELINKVYKELILN